MSDLTPELAHYDIPALVAEALAMNDVCPRSKCVAPTVHLLATLLDKATIALDAAEKERDEAIEALADTVSDRELALDKRISVLEKALTEHHAYGVMDGVLVGDVCPVCSRLGLAGSTPPPATPVLARPRHQEDDGA